MSIDRIGKGGAPPVVPDAGAADATKGAEKIFSVERPDAPPAAQATRELGAVDAASPLGQLKAGAIDLNGYVDLKVEHATRNLQGLSPSELGDIKQMLREQLVSDPGLVDLVRTATGKAPSPPED